MEDTANAVQIAEGGVGLWKGGAKLAQVLKNPETRQAFLKLVKQPQDAWDVAKQMNPRGSEAKQLQAMAEEQAAADAQAARRSQVRTVDRSERIRTYNFPENRISDHRTGYKSYNLDQVLDGDLQPVLDSAVEADLEARLAAVAE